MEHPVNEIGEPIGEPRPPRKSTQKLADLIGRASELQVDEQSARILQGLRLVRPMIMGYIPTDPDELDGTLLRLAGFALALRSDDAAVQAELDVDVDEQLDAEAEEVPES